MADISFPSGLLEKLAGRPDVTTSDDHARDKGDIGPARVRPRSPRDYDSWSVRLAPLTLAQKDELLEFYNATTERGTLKFNIPHVEPAAFGARIIEARMTAPQRKRLGFAAGRELWAATFDIIEA